MWNFIKTFYKALAALLLALLPACDSPMSRTLEIKVAPEATQFNQQGPVGILITLQNRSQATVEFNFPYPAPAELSLISQDSRLRAVDDEAVVNREAIPRRLAPGQVLRTRHELRRYFHLPDRGRFDVEVRLDITVQPINAAGEPKGSVEVIRRQQAVEIVIVPDVGRGLERQLQQFAQAMRSEDEQQRAEAVEAFAHLGGEEALPYLREALELRRQRAEAMRGLARIGSEASFALIEDALGDSDLPTLQVGLSTLRAAGRPIQVATLRVLVSSVDHAVQYSCLEHLVVVGTPEHMAVIKPLTDSPNGAVAELARRFLARFP